MGINLIDFLRKINPRELAEETLKGFIKGRVVEAEQNGDVDKLAQNILDELVVPLAEKMNVDTDLAITYGAPLAADLARSAINKGIEIVWGPIEDINPGDREDPAPQLDDDEDDA